MVSIFCDQLDGECFYGICDHCDYNVSRETNYYDKPIETTDHYDRHDNDVLTHVYYNGTHKILECIKPTVCRYYEPFEGVCLIECTWCDNPYHCRLNNVSRETFYTIPDIWHYINFCSAMVLCPLCCEECSRTTRTRCLMYDIAMDLIFETGVC